MTQKVRLWEIRDGRPATIPEKEIRAENDLEEWLEKDISILDSRLLVIGRQVVTDYGGKIDLLCLDGNGDTVAVELKRGMTPREVTAQALDYASWVRGLSRQRLLEIADDYFALTRQSSLEEAFQDKFKAELPETLNDSHRSVIVAEAMDASTTRILRYLSDFNVPVNVSTVQHFVDDSTRRMLAQVYLIDPEEAEVKARQSSKRASQTVAGLKRMAHESGIGEVYDHFREQISGIFTHTNYPRSVVCELKSDDGRWRRLMSVDAVRDEDRVGLPFVLHATRIQEFFGIEVGKVKQLLPDEIEDTESIRDWGKTIGVHQPEAIGYKGYFITTQEIDRFMDALRAAKSR